MVFHEVVGPLGIGQHSVVPSVGRVIRVHNDADQRVRAGRLNRLVVAGCSHHSGGVDGRVVRSRVQVVLPAPILLVAHRHMARRDAIGQRGRDPGGSFAWFAASVAGSVRAVIRRQRHIEVSGNSHVVDEIRKRVIRIRIAAIALRVGRPVVEVGIRSARPTHLGDASGLESIHNSGLVGNQIVPDGHVHSQQLVGHGGAAARQVHRHRGSDGSRYC